MDLHSANVTRFQVRITSNRETIFRRPFFPCYIFPSVWQLEKWCFDLNSPPIRSHNHLTTLCPLTAEQFGYHRAPIENHNAVDIKQKTPFRVWCPSMRQNQCQYLRCHNISTHRRVNIGRKPNEDVAHLLDIIYNISVNELTWRVMDEWSFRPFSLSCILPSCERSSHELFRCGYNEYNMDIIAGSCNRITDWQVEWTLTKVMRSLIYSLSLFERLYFMLMLLCSSLYVCLNYHHHLRQL